MIEGVKFIAHLSETKGASALGIGDVLVGRKGRGDSGWGGDCHSSDGVEGGTIRGASVRVGEGGGCSKRAATEGWDSRSETASVRALTESLPINL